jgi:hypothetical protein
LSDFPSIDFPFGYLRTLGSAKLDRDNIKADQLVIAAGLILLEKVSATCLDS